MREQTLVLIKPEIMQKKMTGYVLSKLAERNIDIVGIKTVKVTEELAKEHYKHLKDKPFFPDLIDYILGKKHNVNYIIAIVYEGENCIQVIRDVAGATNPEKAEPTSLRGSFGRVTTQGLIENVIHASSSEEDAEVEIKLWFFPNELMSRIYPTDKVEINKTEIVWK